MAWRFSPCKVQPPRMVIICFPTSRDARQPAVCVLSRLGAQAHDVFNSRYALGDGLDGAALTGSVSSLENDTDFGSSRFGPFLELNQLSMELGEFALIFFGLELDRGPARLVWFCLSLRALLISYFGHDLLCPIDWNYHPRKVVQAKCKQTNGPVPTSWRAMQFSCLDLPLDLQDSVIAAC